MKLERHLENPDETVGLVMPPEEMLDGADTARFDPQLLVDMSVMAVDLGWENVEVLIKDDHPIMVKSEDANAYLAVAPILEDEEDTE